MNDVLKYTSLKDSWYVTDEVTLSDHVEDLIFIPEESESDHEFELVGNKFHVEGGTTVGIVFTEGENYIPGVIDERNSLFKKKGEKFDEDEWLKARERACSLAEWLAFHINEANGEYDEYDEYDNC